MQPAIDFYRGVRHEIQNPRLAGAPPFGRFGGINLRASQAPPGSLDGDSDYPEDPILEPLDHSSYDNGLNAPPMGFGGGPAAMRGLSESEPIPRDPDEDDEVDQQQRQLEQQQRQLEQQQLEQQQQQQQDSKSCPLPTETVMLAAHVELPNKGQFEKDPAWTRHLKDDGTILLPFKPKQLGGTGFFIFPRDPRAIELLTQYEEFYITDITIEGARNPTNHIISFELLGIDGKDQPIRWQKPLLPRSQIHSQTEPWVKQQLNQMMMTIPPELRRAFDPRELEKHATKNKELDMVIVSLKGLPDWVCYQFDAFYRHLFGTAPNCHTKAVYTMTTEQFQRLKEGLREAAGASSAPVKIADIALRISRLLKDDDLREDADPKEGWGLDEDVRSHNRSIVLMLKLSFVVPSVIAATTPSQ